MLIHLKQLMSGFKLLQQIRQTQDNLHLIGVFHFRTKVTWPGMFISLIFFYLCWFVIRGGGGEYYAMFLFSVVVGGLYLCWIHSLYNIV